MSDLEKRFKEDRQMRDTARLVMMADIAHARTSLSAKGIANRVGGRIGDGAKDVLDTAKIHTDDNRGVIAALIGAVLLWFCREPILEILGLSGARDEGDDPVSAPSQASEPDDDLEQETPAETPQPAAAIPTGDNDEQ